MRNDCWFMSEQSTCFSAPPSRTLPTFRSRPKSGFEPSPPRSLPVGESRVMFVNKACLTWHRAEMPLIFASLFNNSMASLEEKYGFCGEELRVKRKSQYNRTLPAYSLPTSYSTSPPCTRKQSSTAHKYFFTNSLKLKSWAHLMHAFTKSGVTREPTSISAQVAFCFGSIMKHFFMHLKCYVNLWLAMFLTHLFSCSKLM